MELPGFSVFNPRALHSIKQVNGLIGFSHWMVDFDIPPELEARQGKAFRRSLAKYIGFWIGCWIALLVSTAYLVSQPTFRIPETAILLPLWILLGVNSNSAFRNVKSLKLNQVFGYLLKGQMSEVRNIETQEGIHLICALASEVQSNRLSRVAVNSSWLCLKGGELGLLELETLSTPSTTSTSYEFISLAQQLQRIDSDTEYSPKVTHEDLAAKIGHQHWHRLPQSVLMHEKFVIELVTYWPLLIEYVDDCPEYLKRHWLKKNFLESDDKCYQHCTSSEMMMLEFLTNAPIGHHVPSVIALDMARYALDSKNQVWINAVYHWLEDKLLPKSSCLNPDIGAMLELCAGSKPIAVGGSDIKWAIEDFYEKIIELIIQFKGIDTVALTLSSNESKQGFMRIFGLEKAIAAFPLDRALFIKHDLGV